WRGPRHLRGSSRSTASTPGASTTGPGCATSSASGTAWSPRSAVTRCGFVRTRRGSWQNRHAA
ncbi:MAG: hypothetical protein AVDCRST_MAG16-298, partial [uncultured Frankineae bacterium]